MEENEKTLTRDDVNAALKRTDIKGKEYIDVAQRVNGFWKLFPNGSIRTEWLVLEKDWCVCKAIVEDMGTTLAEGTAFEVKNHGRINPTSYIENCETSAVGRALGLAGIGSTEGIASADEMEMAMNKQQEKPKAETKFIPLKNKPKAAQKQEDSELAKSKQILAEACREFARNTGLDANGLMKGVTLREDYEENKEDPEWFYMVAAEFGFEG